jgi:hypothetical protein
MPDFTRWTVTQTGTAPAQGQAGETQKTGAKQLPPQKIVGERTGDIRHISITYGNGYKTEFWKKDGIQYVASTGWKYPVISAASPDDISGDFAWISAKNFDGFRKVAGGDCMVFHDKILPSGVTILPALAPLEKVAGDYQAPVYTPIDPETLKIKAVAYIDLDRRVPVALQMGDVITTYKIEAIDPPVPLQLPPQVQAAFDNHNQQLAASVRKTVRP